MSKLDELLDHERRSLGRDVHLVRYIETPEGVDLLIYDCDPLPTDRDLGPLHERRWVITMSDGSRTSGIVSSEFKKESQDA